MKKNKKTQSETTGVCLFAYNNTEINYAKIAYLCALSVKKYMKHNTTAIIVDYGTEAYLNSQFSTEQLDRAFDYIIAHDVTPVKNTRVNHDSPYTTFNSQFTNHNKHQIYEYSPFDRTLLIDTDFVIANNSLDGIFETERELAMYDTAINLRNDLPLAPEIRLHPGGINMWWSTVVYFRKTPFAKLFFDMWEHIRDNWDFYKFRYGFPGHMYRTDYAASIAVHIMNGMIENDMVDTLPGDFMRFQDQKDDILHIHDSNDIVFLANDQNQHWKDLAVRMQDENIHVMNKRSIMRHYDTWIGCLTNE